MTIPLPASIQTILQKIESLAQTAAQNDKATLSKLAADLQTCLSNANDYTDTSVAQAVQQLIGGADISGDDLKELGDKILALMQTDAGLVSASAAQTFDEIQQSRARSNIGAAALADLAAVVQTAASAQTVASNAQTTANNTATALSQLSADIGSIAQIEADATAFDPVGIFTTALTA